jgi:multidrug efflux pump subunit AcrA (membrane-fusion protein)
MTDSKTQRRRSKSSYFVAAVLGIAALLAGGYIPRHARDQKAEAAAKRERDSLPIVTVVQVRQAPPVGELLLPGTMTPITEAYIYARASGYVRRRNVDIGDHVREGQVMAQIEAPDLDQQVAQSRASLAQAEQQLGQTRAALDQANAQLELARVTKDRYVTLGARGAVSRQDVDQQEATFRTTTANVHSAEANVRAAQQNVEANRANVDRMATMQAFERVTAPFAGIVTARNIDVGALISSGGAGLQASTTPSGGTQQSGGLTVGSSPLSSGGGSATEMFRVARVDRLRMLIDVPESDAPNIRVGQAATILLHAFPGKTFSGAVTRMAAAVDPTARTMLTEVQLANPKGILMPGMFAQVQIRSPRGGAPILAPGDALITNAEGIQIAVLENPTREVPPGSETDSRRQPRQIHLQKVELGRDYGPQTEVTAGLSAGEYVVVNPSDDVREGALVVPQVVAEPGSSRRPKPASGAAKQSKR